MRRRDLCSVSLAAAVFFAAALPVMADDASEPRPVGSGYALADSTWPIFHADTRATASSPSAGPGAVESAQSVRSLTGRRVRRPSVSPWTVMAAPYPDGSQAVITTPNDGLAKYLLHDGVLEAVDFLPLDRRALDFDWGILLLSDGLGIATERKRNRFVLFGDAEPDPRSPLRVVATIPVDEARFGALTAHFSLAPDGSLVALTGANKLIAIDIGRGAVTASIDLPAGGGTSFHNSFPIDEAGRIYLSTQTVMVAIDWNGAGFRPAWQARYDMRGPGCEDVEEGRSRRKEAIDVARGKPCTGSGTTPTLIDGPDGGVVVIVDGHSPSNNLVAFWRRTVPEDWNALGDPRVPGKTLDRRVAGVIALPHSSPEGAGFTAENSPAALGQGLVIAQWAGFRPGRDAPRGVQRVDWDPAARQFRLLWANPDVHFNGVPTIACDASDRCQAYGMGRYGNDYAYTSLDFATGIETGRVDLGTSRAVLDQGNNHAVAADGSIVYSGRYAMVRVE